MTADDSGDELLRLAELLVRHKEAVVRSWAERVLADPAVPDANRLPEPVLRDHIPNLVDRIAEALGRNRENNGSAEAAGRSAGHEGDARAHAVSRFQAGYSMGAVLREVSHFRAALTEFCDRHGISFSGRAASLVQAAIDEAMAHAAVEVDGTATRNLELEREWLRRVLELMPVSVVLSDASGNVVQTNAAAKALWANIVASDRPTSIARALRLGTTIGPQELAITTSEGAKHDVLASASPVRDEDYEIVGAVEVEVDITAQKLTETRLRDALAALRAKEAELRTLADTIPALAWYADERGELRWKNRRWYEYTGTRPETEQAQSGSLIPFHRDDAAGVTAKWREAVEKGEPWEAELRLRRHDGVYRWFLARATPLRDANGRIERWFGTNVDIDDQKRAAQELERAAMFRERFMGILGHDLRTPLSSIAMASALLMRHERLPDAALRIVQRIANSTTRMTRMVTDLLDFARARQVGGVPIAPHPMQLEELCRTVVDEIALANPTRRIEVTVNGNTDGVWDRERIAQVVSNLVSNALVHGARDTPVRVEVDGRGSERVALSVINVGPPIPPETAEGLFDPFKRGPPREGTRTSGLGLGLYIASAIVNAHGGRIDVTNDSSSGTVAFRVELPRLGPDGTTERRSSAKGGRAQ